MDEINWMQQNINAAQDASETLQGNVETLKERGYSEEQIRNMTPDQHDELANAIRTENDNNTLVANGLDPDTMTPEQRNQALYNLQPDAASPIPALLGALGSVGGFLAGAVGLSLGNGTSSSPTTPANNANAEPLVATRPRRKDEEGGGTEGKGANPNKDGDHDIGGENDNSQGFLAGISTLYKKILTKVESYILTKRNSIFSERPLIPNSQDETSTSISLEDLQVIKPKILKEIEGEFIINNKHKKDSDALAELQRKKDTLQIKVSNNAELTKADEKKLIALDKAIENAKAKVVENNKNLKDYLAIAEKVIDRSTTSEGLNDLGTITDPNAGTQVGLGKGTALQLRVAFEKIRMIGKENFTLNQEGQLANKKQDLETKKKVLQDLKNLNSNGVNEINSLEHNSKIEEINQKIKNLDKEIQAQEKEVKAFESRVESLKKIFDPVKNLIFSDISTEKLSNLTANQTCKLYTDYMQRVLNGIEDRGYSQNYIDRLRDGDVALGKKHKYPVLGQGSGSYSGYTQSEISENSSYDNPEAEPLTTEKLNKLLNSRPAFVQVHYDTDPTKNPGPNHFFMAKVKYNDDGTYELISSDHNNSVKRGEKLELENLYGVYK